MTSNKILLKLAAFVFVFSAFSTIDAQENKFVTIVKVKAPTVATEEFIKQGFVKAIPTYQKIEGLEFKAFSSQKTDDGVFFGGVYLWKNQASAEKWFSPQWFERVKSTYGVAGKVVYYQIIADKSFIGKDFDYQSDKTVTVFVNDLREKDLKAYTKKSNGLLRSYFVKTTDKFGAILLFINEQMANVFVKKKKIANQEFFNTPVLLNNIK